MISPFFTEVVLILSISQTFDTIMIIKSFVALMFVVNVDNQFSDGFPKEIKSVSKDITLIVGKDQNTYKKIYKRVKRAIQTKESIPWWKSFINCTVNILYTAILNFYIVVYYYFMPLYIIII